MYVNVFFVKRCLYSAVSLTLVKEQCFIRIIMIIIMMMIIIIIIIIITLVQRRTFSPGVLLSRYTDSTLVQRSKNRM